MKHIDIAARLRCGVAPVILAVALLSPSIAIAQDETPQDAQEAGVEQNIIVVTGSILRQTDTQTVSPVTVVSTDSLDKRGISTIQEGLQTLSANNGPALTNSFTSNGAFAAGASALSLRGLSTSSTLVLFDGLRAAYYPLSDDGTRNFVDLNTIPDDMIERVEVLRDGASSSYGADAIAGVVNIITKKEFKGLTLRADTGISSRGDAPEYRFSAMAGMGDLDDDGYNAYISGFYYNSHDLKMSDRPFPYNTGDWRSICNEGTCGQNNVVNGLDENGLYSQGLISLIRGEYMVQPYDATNTTAQGPYQNLSTDCGPGTSYTLTAADLAANPNAPATVCQFDRANLYGKIRPDIERFGVSAKFTGRVSDSIEAYAEVNFIQSKASYEDFPADIYTHAPTGIFYPRYSARSSGGAFTANSGPLTLPIYVCPERVNCATSPNRTLNPNNPFAAQGQVARLVGLDPNHQRYNQTLNRAYRLAFGVNG
ncbi:MAG: TonB-dependent receptor, partial [Sphingobium sp.]